MKEIPAVIKNTTALLWGGFCDSRRYAIMDPDPRWSRPIRPRNEITFLDMFQVPEEVVQEIYLPQTHPSETYHVRTLDRMIRDLRNPTSSYRRNIDLKWGFHFAPRSARESIRKNGLVPDHRPVDPGSPLYGEYIERQNSVFFYTSPVIPAMKHFGDVMWKHLDYDLHIVDIQHCEVVVDELLSDYNHSHDDGTCVYTPVAVRTQEWYNARPVYFIEVPDHIRDDYAMNESWW